MIEAEDMACVATTDTQVDVQGGRMSCLMGRDLTEYNYVSVGKDGFIPISVKPMTNATRLVDDVVWRMDAKDSIEWLERRTKEYRSRQNDIRELVEDLGDEGKLGWGFSSIYELEEANIEGEGIKRPTFINVNLGVIDKEKIRELLKEFKSCFVWEYTETPGLRELVEHRLPIKEGFRPYRQTPRNFSPEIVVKIKEEVDRLLKARLIQPCRYAEWVSNIVLAEKKNTGKIRVCVDFQNLNRATPKNKYPMPVADVLVNSTSSNKIMSFLDDNVGYN
jgi:hypothetical protein